MKRPDIIVDHSDGHHEYYERGGAMVTPLIGMAILLENGNYCYCIEDGYLPPFLGEIESKCCEYEQEYNFKHTPIKMVSLFDKDTIECLIGWKRQKRHKLVEELKAKESKEND